MSTLPSQQQEPLSCELLCDDDLQAVSGGVALVTGRVAAGVKVPTGTIAKPGGIAGIKPIGCVPCRSGIPLDLIKNPVIYPVLNSPLSRF